MMRLPNELRRQLIAIMNRDGGAVVADDTLPTGRLLLPERGWAKANLYSDSAG